MPSPHRIAVSAALNAVGYTEFKPTLQLLTRADEAGTSLNARVWHLTGPQMATLHKAGKLGWRFHSITVVKANLGAPITVHLVSGRAKMDVAPDGSYTRL
jgi:hypothetical protein